jgi:transposase-like protein
MSQRAATITSLPMTFEVVKAMQADGLEWGEGYRPLGRQALEEIIEDQMAAAVDRYLDQPRGLTGEGFNMICVDGGSGLLAALPGIFPNIPVQRCWAHKIRNVLAKVRKVDQPKVKRALHKIMNAANAPAPARPRGALQSASKSNIRQLSPACATTLTSCSPAFATKPKPGGAPCAPPTPSSDASEKSADGPGQWARSRTKPAWTASCSPSYP